VVKAEIKTREFLLHHDLLIHENGRFRFTAGLLRCWVARQ